MTSSTISPLRRIAATLATFGVLAFGAVAVAPAALADDQSSAAATAIASTSAPSYIVAPLPAGPIKVTIGKAKITLPPQAAQVINTIEANLYASQGYQIAFTEKGELVIGKKPCDPNKPLDKQKDCALPSDSRF